MDMWLIFYRDGRGRWESCNVFLVCEWWLFVEEEVFICAVFSWGS